MSGGAPSSPCVLISWRTAAAVVFPLMIHTLEVWAGLSLSPAVIKPESTASSFLLFIFSSPPDDCALLLLACLHCHFYDFMVLLPGAFEGAVSRCFPSYRHVRLATEREQQEKDCCSKVELDCNCCGSCKETGEFIEFAMEISEVCYRWGMLPFWRWPPTRNSTTVSYSSCNKLPALLIPCWPYIIVVIIYCQPSIFSYII